VANENHQNDVAQPPVPMQQPTVAAALGARGASRRRFARTGAGATGVLLTLTSQPGMACSVCRSPSGYQSVMTAAKTNAVVSNKPNSQVTCAGWPPSTWYRNMGTWKTTTFNSAFTCTTMTQAIGAATAEKLLSQCVRGTPAFAPQRSSMLAMWLVAAYLNVKHEKSSFLTVEILQNIWREFNRSGTYTPTAGVTPWQYADIIVYLSGTMD
jgi:hypothetical protein